MRIDWCDTAEFLPFDGARPRSSLERARFGRVTGGE
jgi:hypothetical protein